MIRIKEITPAEYQEEGASTLNKELLEVLSKYDIERIYNLVTLFNNQSPDIVDYEREFLIKYVTTGKHKPTEAEGFKIYISKAGTPLILSKKQLIGNINQSNYFFILETSSQLTPEELQKQNWASILKELKYYGFEMLHFEGEILAFCKKRNIVLYSPSIEHCIQGYANEYQSLFQQPTLYRGRVVMGSFSQPSSCDHITRNFPTFTKTQYLRLSSNESPQELFSESMKKIIAYPDLYNAIGKTNQNLIDKILREQAKTQFAN